MNLNMQGGDVFEARNSPWRMIGLALLSCGFVVLGAWLAGFFGPSPGDDSVKALAVGWTCMIFFGACGLVALPRIGNRDVVMRLDRNGVWWRQWSDDVIPWSQVVGMKPLTINRQKMLGLKLANPAMFPSTRLLGRLAAANRMFGADIYLTTTGTDRSHADMEQAVMRFTMPGRPIG